MSVRCQSCSFGGASQVPSCHTRSARDERPILVFIDDMAVSYHDERFSRFFHDMSLNASVSGVGAAPLERLISSPSRLAPLLTSEEQMRRYSRAILLFIGDRLPDLPPDLDTVVRIDAFRLFLDGRYKKIFPQSPVAEGLDRGRALTHWAYWEDVLA